MKISVGIPFYNAEKYLRYAILSVLNQSFTDFELLLVDDGSNDNSLTIAQSFNDSRISIFSDGMNKGLSYRLNELVSKAKGTFFARMDADDIMSPDRLKKQVEFLEKQPEIDVVGSKVYTINTQNKVVGQIQFKRTPNNIRDVCHHQCFIHPSVMAKRQWFLDHPYNPSALRIEDFELWSRSIQHSNFFNMSEGLLFYRTEGLPYLGKYLKSNKGERRVLRNIHKKNKAFKCNKYIIKSYIKCGMYIIFTALHLQNFLVHIRSSKLTKEEQSSATRQLEKALQGKYEYD